MRIANHTGNGPHIIKGITKFGSNRKSCIILCIIMGYTKLTSDKKLCIRN